VGLCFEGAPVDPELARKSKLLLERVGYYGVFELEFILAEGRSLLIDFNPRFYNQVGLDVARGLPLPQLAWAAARGDDDEVARLAEHTPAGLAPDAHAFCNAFSFEVMLGAQWVIGSMSTGEVARWRRWRVDHRATLVDAVADADDRRPQIAEITKQLFEYVRNPRLFWRAHRPRREATNRTE
jgi:D-aspartate ligase